jgi:hypothetical protein
MSCGTSTESNSKLSASRAAPPCPHLRHVMFNSEAEPGSRNAFSWQVAHYEVLASVRSLQHAYHILTAKSIQAIGPPNLQAQGPALDVVSLIPGIQLASLSGIASMCCATISTTGMVFCSRVAQRGCAKMATAWSYTRAPQSRYRTHEVLSRFAGRY